MMLLTFKPARCWRRRSHFREPGGGAMGAFVALLVGILRAASLARGNG